MTDATTQTPAPEEVLPGNTPEGVPAEPQQEEESKPQFVTVEDLARREEELLRRFKQSDRDRSKKIEGELANIRQLLEKPGVKLDATQEAALREEIANRIDDEQFPQEQAAQPAETAPTADPVAQFVNDIFDAAGTKVTPKDPEWNEFQKVLDATWNDPKGIGKVTIAATRAAEAKAKRLAANQESASARVSGAGNASASSTPDAPATDLWKQAYRK